MREIKFRAWTEPENKMLSWNNLLNMNLHNALTIPEQCGLILMQYTGLKDKNGKEIYEGDIVKSILILDNGIKLRTNIDVVEWKEEECCFMLTSDIRHFHNNLELEVIGNIYDNPDLLKEE